MFFCFIAFVEIHMNNYVLNILHILHTCIHTYIHTYTHTHTHTQACMLAKRPVHIHTYIHKHLHRKCNPRYLYY